MQIKSRICLGVIFASFLVSHATFAQSSVIDKGKVVAERACQACHGEEGRSEDKSIPSIGGFSAVAIMDLLDTYKNDGRPASKVLMDDGTQSDMVQVVEENSESDLRAVALYYASLEWQPIMQPFDQQMAKRGSKIHGVKCGKCHLKEGGIPESDYALLLGQWKEYLVQQFADFDSRERRMASKMQQKYDSLSEADKLALIELYASAGKY